VDVEASGFLMDFKNLVTPIRSADCPPHNAGTQRFKGLSPAFPVHDPKTSWPRATYSYHDARFTDYVPDFGGVPRSLRGKRLEMSATISRRLTSSTRRSAGFWAASMCI